MPSLSGKETADSTTTMRENTIYAVLLMREDFPDAKYYMVVCVFLVFTWII